MGVDLALVAAKAIRECQRCGGGLELGEPPRTSRLFGFEPVASLAGLAGGPGEDMSPPWWPAATPPTDPAGLQSFVAPAGFRAQHAVEARVRAAGRAEANKDLLAHVWASTLHSSLENKKMYTYIGI